MSIARPTMISYKISLDDDVRYLIGSYRPCDEILRGACNKLPVGVHFCPVIPTLAHITYPEKNNP